MKRETLPQRRGHEVVEFRVGKIDYTAGLGRYEDGRLAEIFLDAAKSGTDAQTAARDAAVCASLLLQFGCPLETIRDALTREPDGTASGPLGQLLDMVDGNGAAPSPEAA